MYKNKNLNTSLTIECKSKLLDLSTPKIMGILNLTNDSFYDALSSISIGILLMVSGIFLGYEMKHLITGETVNKDAYKIVEKALSNEEGVLDILSIKIVSIGTDKYLGIVKVAYLDSFTDLEIIDLKYNYTHLYII